MYVFCIKDSETVQIVDAGSSAGSNDAADLASDDTPDDIEAHVEQGTEDLAEDVVEDTIENLAQSDENLDENLDENTLPGVLQQSENQPACNMEAIQLPSQLQSVATPVFAKNRMPNRRHTTQDTIYSTSEATIERRFSLDGGKNTNKYYPSHYQSLN